MSDAYEMIRQQLSTIVPFANTVGVVLGPISDGQATATLEQRSEVSNHIGSMHAGAMFTLGEAASGSALAGALGPMVLQARPVAKEARISYVKIAKGTLTATATTATPGAQIRETLNSDGRVVFDVTVDIADAEGETVCEMTVTWHTRMS